MLGSKIALIVDDEIFARLMVIQILMEDDYCVLEASDAAEALDVLDRNDDIDLLITDIGMPGEIDGVGLARTVLSQRPQIATILTSGCTTPSKDEMPDGARFLAKPYTAHTLKCMVRELSTAAARSHEFPAALPARCREHSVNPLSVASRLST